MKSLIRNITSKKVLAIIFSGFFLVCSADTTRFNELDPKSDEYTVPQTETEAVAADKAALDFSDITFGTGDSEISVTQDFTMPTSGSSGTTISWSSNRSAVSIAAGQATVTQPSTLTGDMIVTLTATIEKNGISETKDFNNDYSKSAYSRRSGDIYGRCEFQYAICTWRFNIYGRSL